MKLTISLLIVTSALVSGCIHPHTTSTSVETAINAKMVSETGLKYKISKQGKGSKLKPSAEILIHETINYLNGEQVFSTKTMGAPLAIRLGKGTIATKLENGFIGMQAGEVREFTVSASMIKHLKLHSLISPDAIVVYSVELIGSPFPKWFRGGRVRSFDSEDDGC
ncbi:MAG: FKBP-type peptidyl-prolyl cis-trans isomerase [Fluviicola sp.]|nr:FKBP-type peptidyl-prolyl cis-trans isomerase [Fluviicola sp.]